jgi:hypothetical protein
MQGFTEGFKTGWGLVDTWDDAKRKKALRQDLDKLPRDELQQLTVDANKESFKDEDVARLREQYAVEGAPAAKRFADTWGLKPESVYKPVAPSRRLEQMGTLYGKHGFDGDKFTLAALEAQSNELAAPGKAAMEDMRVQHMASSIRNNDIQAEKARDERARATAKDYAEIRKKEIRKAAASWEGIAALHDEDGAGPKTVTFKIRSDGSREVFYDGKPILQGEAFKNPAQLAERVIAAIEGDVLGFWEANAKTAGRLEPKTLAATEPKADPNLAKNTNIRAARLRARKKWAEMTKEYPLGKGESPLAYERRIRLMDKQLAEDLDLGNSRLIGEEDPEFDKRFGRK